MTCAKRKPDSRGSRYDDFSVSDAQNNALRFSKISLPQLLEQFLLHPKRKLFDIMRKIPLFAFLLRVR